MSRRLHYNTTDNSIGAVDKTGTPQGSYCNWAHCIEALLCSQLNESKEVFPRYGLIEDIACLWCFRSQTWIHLIPIIIVCTRIYVEYHRTLATRVLCWKFLELSAGLSALVCTVTVAVVFCTAAATKAAYCRHSPANRSVDSTVLRLKLELIN